MPTFTYRAMNEAGRVVRGRMMVSGEDELEARLRVTRLDLLSFSRRRSFRPRGGRVQVRDLIHLCIHLEQLDRAGVSVLDGLGDVVEATETPGLRSALAEVREDVRGGLLLSQALARHPRIFDRVFVNLIETGEQTGDLAAAFAQLGRHLKWTDEMHAKVARATRYPLVMLAAVIALAAVMLGWLVPQIVEFLLLQRIALPFATRALIATSEAVAGYGAWLLVAAAAAAMLVRAAARLSEPVALQLDAAKLRLPAFGDTLRKIALARFAHVFATMFRSGIGVLHCLDAGAAVVANRALARSLHGVGRSVRDGRSLADALADSGEFPNLVVRMFRIGEDTGRVGEALDNIAYFYDREADDAIADLIRMIEPAMTVVVGALLLWVVVAVFGPLYDNFSAM